MVIRVVFLGTPQFAVPTLTALLDSPEIEVQAVITQPDRPGTRESRFSSFHRFEKARKPSH